MQESKHLNLNVSISNTQTWRLHDSSLCPILIDILFFQKNFFQKKKYGLKSQPTYPRVADRYPDRRDTLHTLLPASPRLPGPYISQFLNLFLI